MCPGGGDAQCESLGPCWDLSTEPVGRDAPQVRFLGRMGIVEARMVSDSFPQVRQSSVHQCLDGQDCTSLRGPNCWF